MSFLDHVTPLTLDDSSLLWSRPNPVPSMLDCVEYTMGYINHGVFKGFKYVTDDCMILFSVKYGKYYAIYHTVGDKDVALKAVLEWWQTHRELTEKNLKVAHHPADWIPDIQAMFEANGVRLTPGKFDRFGEYIFDIEGIGELKGKKWRKLRADINAFKRNTEDYTYERIDSGNLDEALAVMKRWVKEAKERGAFQMNHRKYRYILENHYNDGLNYLFKVGDVPLSIHLCQPVSPKFWAHTTGMACDRDIPNLSAWAQQVSFTKCEEQGVKQIVDGMAIGEGGKNGFNSTYKRKFKPIQPMPQYTQFYLPGTEQKEENPFFDL